MGKLIEKVCQKGNLVDAWRKVRSNIEVKRRRYSQGIDLVSIREFEADLEENLADLALALKQGSYLPMPVKWVEMDKRGGGKRTIGVLAVRDRIAQRAVFNVIEPVFDQGFLNCSFGFRPGRSVQDAVAQVSSYRRQGCAWVVDADIESCFASLDQRLLMRLVEQEIQDEDILRLIKLWLGVSRLSDRIERNGLSLERVLGITSNYLERGAQWGVDHLLADRGMGYYFPEEPAVDLAMDNQSARQEALHRLVTDLLLLLLTFYRPILKSMKDLPSLEQRLDKKTFLKRTALGSAVAGGLLLLARRIFDREPGPLGTLQGGAISPLLANVYLHQFDLRLTARGHRLVRYADDFLILCRHQGEAKQAMEESREALARLHLSLNKSKTHIVSFEQGFTFLGTYFKAKVTEPIPSEGWRWRLRLTEKRYWEQGRRWMVEMAERSTKEGQQILQQGRELMERGKTSFSQVRHKLTGR